MIMNRINLSTFSSSYGPIEMNQPLDPDGDESFYENRMNREFTYGKEISWIQFWKPTFQLKN